MNAPILIAGACSDLGRGLAWRLSALGYPLVLVDEQQSALETFADELEAAGYPTPLLAIIGNPATLEEDCDQLSSSIPPLAGFIWANTWLDTPTPVLNEKLTHWQTGLLHNLTIPLALLKATYRALTDNSIAYIACPNPEHYTGSLAASSLLWQHWLPLLTQEFGKHNITLKAWLLPKIADRIHRRIWPILPVDHFITIDDAITAWLKDWQP